MASTVTTAICSSFKAEVVQGLHNFTTTSGHVYKLALIASGAAGNISYGASTTNAGTPGTGTPSQSNVGTDEVSGGSYTTWAWTAAQNTTPVLNTTQACVTWSVNPNWTSATINTIGGIIYNSTNSNRSVGAFSFSASVTSGTLTLSLPAASDNNAIIRIT